MAEACELLNGGIPKDCKPNIGGLFTQMWITERSNISGYTYESPGTKIESIELISPAVPFAFAFNKGTSGYTEEQTFDDATGNTLNIQTVTLGLNHREQEKRDKIILLGSFKELAILVKDNNGHYFLLGQEGGCVLRTNSGGSGVAKTDANQYILTLIGEEGSLANEVTEEGALAFINA